MCSQFVAVELEDSGEGLYLLAYRREETLLLGFGALDCGAWKSIANSTPLIALIDQLLTKAALLPETRGISNRLVLFD